WDRQLRGREDQRGRDLGAPRIPRQRHGDGRERVRHRRTARQRRAACLAGRAAGRALPAARAHRHHDPHVGPGGRAAARDSHRYGGERHRASGGMGAHLSHPPRGPSRCGDARDDPHRAAGPRGPALVVRIERRDAVRRTDKYRFYVILAALVVLQFSVRGRLGGDRVAPDFLLLALLIYTIRARPGPSAGAGFLVGLLRDALTPASFGAGALAHTLVGYLSSWSKAVFFAENLFVNGCLFFAGTWCRNLAVALGSGKLKGGMLGWELLVWSPIQSLTTAVAGVLVLWLFGRHLAIRLSDA